MSESNQAGEQDLSIPQKTDFQIQKAEDLHFYDDPRVHQGLESLLSQLKPHLESGEYSTIIGDDKSGRIPTLIVRGVAKKVYEDIDKIAPLTFFYNSSTNSESKTKEFVEAEDIFRERLRDIKKVNPNGRVLIVTDVIVGGEHVGNIGKVINEVGLSYDIASLCLSSNLTQERLLDSYRQSTGTELLPADGNLYLGLPYSVGGFSSPAATGLVEDTSIRPSQENMPPFEKRRVIRDSYTEPVDYEKIRRQFNKPVIFETYTKDQYMNVRKDVNRLTDELYSRIFDSRLSTRIKNTARRIFLGH